MNINTVGIDLAKNNFQLHGVDKAGVAVLDKRLKRNQLCGYISNLPPCTIILEACSGANYWTRQFTSSEHQVKLISPQHVKPYVKLNKNDRNDARAIVEAGTRPSMEFVSPKTLEQQDIQSLHRVRSRLIGGRTALVNQIRGLLSEYGVIVKKGIGHIRRELPLILEDAENELTVSFRETLSDLSQELRHIDKRIDAINKRLKSIFNTNKVCQQLSKIEGFGVMITTALVASIGDVNVFKNGRQLSAWLGLTPKQHSSGEQSRLLGITKRGDTYLRQLLVHGARSVVYRSKKKTDRRSQWINRIATERGENKACVALANKNMRIAWSMLYHDTQYRVAC